MCGSQASTYSVAVGRTMPPIRTGESRWNDQGHSMNDDELSYNVTVRAVSCVSVVVNTPYCLFTLTIVETGKNAVEV